MLLTLVAALCNAIPTGKLSLLYATICICHVSQVDHQSIVLNGAVGADLHIPFPVAIRASYGTYFGYFCVASRAILALFWFGIQSAYGGQCVTPVSDNFLKRVYSPNCWNGLDNKCHLAKLSGSSKSSAHISSYYYTGHGILSGLPCTPGTFSVYPDTSITVYVHLQVRSRPANGIGHGYMD